MKKEYIIKKKSEIDALFKDSLRSRDNYFSIFLKKDINNVNFKFAMSIGRKYGNAVARNKIKRQIRSIVRLNKNLIEPSSNFVIVIRPTANTLKYEEIELNILNLLNRLKVLENN